MKNLSLLLRSGVVMLLLWLGNPMILRSQTLQPNYGAPTAAVNICDGNALFKVRIIGSSTACDTAILSIVLPHGYNFISGSTARSDTNGIVSELSPHGDTTRLLVLHIPTSPDSSVISFSAYADCTANDTASSSESAARYILSSQCMATYSVTSNTITTQSAALAISTITNSNYSGTIGGSFSRVITIANNGLGTASQIILQDTMGRGLALTGYTAPSGWSVTRTSAVSGTDTIQSYLLTGPSLTTGQQILLTENIRIVSQCYLQSRMIVYFGCKNGPCTNNSVNANATAGATVNNSQAPVVKIITTSMAALICRGTDYAQTMAITNTGNAPLTNFQGNIFSSTWSAVPGTQYFSASRSYASGGQSAFSNIRYKLGINGTWNTLPLDSAKSFTTPGSAITGLSSSIYFNIAQINAGDTVYINYQERNSPLPGINSGNTMEVSGNELWYTYMDACGNRTSPTATFLRNYVQTRINNDATLPSYMEQATSYSFSYTFSEANSGIYVYTGASASTIRFDLILPANIVFTGNVSNIGITKSGAAYGTPTGYSYNTTTNVLSVTYLVTSTFNINGLLGAVLTYDKMMLNCAATANGNTVTLNTYLKANSGCANEEQMSTLPIKVGLACPVACGTGGGLSFNSFAMRRTNYGSPDNDNNGVGDIPGTFDYTKVKTNYALLGDTLEASFYGKVSVTASSPSGGFKYGVAIDTITSPYNAYFTNLYASVQLYAAGSSTPFYTCNNVPVSGGTTAYRKVDFSISALNSVCALPSGHTVFNNGDSIVVNIFYRVTGSVPVALTTVNITNTFGISSAAISTQTQADQYACGAKYSGRVVLVGKGTGTSTGNLTYSISGTSTVAVQGTNVGFLGPCCVFAGSMPFTNEYRSVTIYDSASFVMPTGYDYVSASVTYSYTTGLGTSASKTVSVTPVNAGASTLVFNLLQLFTNASLPYGDQGTVMNLYVTVRPNCAAPDKAVGTVYIRQIPTPGSGFTFPNYISMHADTIYLTKPKVTGSATNSSTTTNTNTASWEVQIANANSNTASSVWLAKNNTPGSVTITSVQKLSASGGTVTSTLSPSAGGIYQLGNFGQTNAYYLITGTTTSCAKDSLGIAYWYDCNSSGYPSAVTAQAYRQSFYLYVQPQLASMQISILESPSASASHNLCEQLNYGLQVLNTGAGDANSPRVTIYLPSAGGIHYAAGTFTLEYPTGSGTYVSISDANVAVSGSTIQLSIPTSYITRLTSNQKMKVRFGLQTDCSFTSGQSVRFAASATSPCGSASNSTVQQSSRILMNGVPSSSNVYIIRSYVDSARQSCNAASDLTTTYRFVLVNQGPLVTGSSDLYSIELPSLWSMSTGSIAYPRNTSGAYFDHSSNGVYYFAAGTGLAVGDSLVMTATLSMAGTDAASLSSGSSDPIEENAILLYSGSCTSSGTTCPSSQAITTSHTSTSIPYVNKSAGSQTVYGSNGQWNGYMYQGTTFQTYKGMVHEAGGRPDFDESFGGATVNYATNACAVYTENFSARYLLNQTLVGANYKITVGGGDGYRFSTDGGSTWVVNKWTTHAYDTTAVYLTLNGNYNFVIEYYGATGANRVSFRMDTMYVLNVGVESFTGRLVNGEMRLTWQVAAAGPGSSFVIERAGANNEYMPIGTVAGSPGIRSYQFADPYPLQGRSSYRLRINDGNGQIDYSSVIPLVLNAGADATLQLFPSIITGQKCFYIQSDRTLNNMKISIGDLNGRVLKTLKIARLDGNARQVIESNGCFGTSGVYTVLIEADELNIPVVKKLIVQ